MIDEAASESFSDPQDLEQFLEDDETCKRGQSLVFKLESWNLGDFSSDIFSATLHRSTFLFCVRGDKQTHYIKVEFFCMPPAIK